MDKIFIFIFAFIAPMIYWRTLFYLVSHIFDAPFTRTRTGLQVHHLHYGVLLILIASISLLFGKENNYIFGLLGLGLGLVMDEFIPSLLMPGDRPLELETYKKSLPTTITLFLAITFSILLLGFIFK